MNEEELKKRREYLREGETDGDFLNWCDKVDLYEKGFQKGELKQKREFLEWLKQTEIVLFGKDEEILMKIKEIKRDIGENE